MEIKNSPKREARVKSFAKELQKQFSQGNPTRVLMAAGLAVVGAPTTIEAAMVLNFPQPAFVRTIDTTSSSVLDTPLAQATGRCKVRVRLQNFYFESKPEFAGALPTYSPGIYQYDKRQKEKYNILGPATGTEFAIDTNTPNPFSSERMKIDQNGNGVDLKTNQTVTELIGVPHTTRTWVDSNNQSQSKPGMEFSVINMKNGSKSGHVGGCGLTETVEKMTHEPGQTDKGGRKVEPFGTEIPTTPRTNKNVPTLISTPTATRTRETITPTTTTTRRIETLTPTVTPGVSKETVTPSATPATSRETTTPTTTPTALRSGQIPTNGQETNPGAQTTDVPKRYLWNIFGQYHDFLVSNLGTSWGIAAEVVTYLLVVTGIAGIIAAVIAKKRRPVIFTP